MNVAKIIENMGAFLKNDHFVYSSGKHGDIYINKNDLLLHPIVVGDICKELAEKFESTEIDIVVGPAIGGVVLSQWTAYHLSKLQGKDVVSLFAEKGAEKTFNFTRGYDKLLVNKRILIVDDLVNSSGTARSIIQTVQDLGGQIVAFSVLINRNPQQLTSSSFDPIPFVSLCEVDISAYEASECPLCKKGVPINTTVGHGKKFLERSQCSSD